MEKMVKWRLERGVTEQTESVLKGFNDVSTSRKILHCVLRKYVYLWGTNFDGFLG